MGKISIHTCIRLVRRSAVLLSFNHGVPGFDEDPSVPYDRFFCSSFILYTLPSSASGSLTLAWLLLLLLFVFFMCADGQTFSMFLALRVTRRPDYARWLTSGIRYFFFSLSLLLLDRVRSRWPMPISGTHRIAIGCLWEGRRLPLGGRGFCEE